MAPWRIPAFLGASLTLALYLTCPSPSARAAVESDNPPSNIRFETPSTYCGITDASAVDNAMVTRVRQHSEPEMVVLGLFADCEQKRYWNGDPTKEPTRFGAAFLHKSGNRFKTVTETRTAFLQKLAFRLGPWDRASSRPLFEQMTKGALAIKLQRAHILAVTGEAVFVGFNAITATPE